MTSEMPVWRVARIAAVAGSILIIFLGAARSFGGLVLLTPMRESVGETAAAPAELTVLGIGLEAVAFLCIWAGVSVLRRRPSGVLLGLIALVAFVAGGIANGTALYGAPQPAGIIGNLVVAAVIAVLLLLGRGSLTNPPR